MEIVELIVNAIPNIVGWIEESVASLTVYATPAGFGLPIAAMLYGFIVIFLDGE